MRGAMGQSPKTETKLRVQSASSSSLESRHGAEDVHGIVDGTLDGNQDVDEGGAGGVHGGRCCGERWRKRM